MVVVVLGLISELWRPIRFDVAARFHRSNAVLICTIAAVSLAVALFSFRQTSRGLDRVVMLSDARKAARQTLVALLDQEAALRQFSLTHSREAIDTFEQAAVVERHVRDALRAYVTLERTSSATSAFSEFEVADKTFAATAKLSLQANRLSHGTPPVESSIPRRSLNTLIDEFNAAGKRTVSSTKNRLFWAGLVSVAVTMLFGAAALTIEKLRQRVQLLRTIERENVIGERERANAANMRADLLQTGKAMLEHEIIERTHIERQLAYAAFHDDLTGLANRALFIERLNVTAEEASGEASLRAILFLDLDRFKVINDSLGHQAGDVLLVAVARRLEGCLRPGDTLARFGGDEFTILLEDLEDVDVACAIAQRVLLAFDRPFTIGGREVFTSASVGIATTIKGAQRPQDVLRDADIAMYRAKELGKQRFEVFAPELLDHAVALLEVETDLARALERDEFRLYYQPIIALHDGRITGFEALVRWQHPVRGVVSPDDFIQIAEETGGIIAIGSWILQEACRQMQAWRRTFPSAENFRVNVNVSAKQLAMPNFTAIVQDALAVSGLPADSLNLEITESVIIHNAEIARGTLAELRRLGVRMQLDDFGTGYSSLAYLHEFPIDAVKIDRSFVSNVGTGLASLEIVRTIIALAENLSMAVTAEGIETPEQLAQLRILNCANGQGYYFSRPADAPTATALIALHDGAPSEVAA